MVGILSDSEFGLVVLDQDDAVSQRYTILENRNDADVCYLTCGCWNTKRWWCKHLSDVLQRNSDGEHGFLTFKVKVPIQPTSNWSDIRYVEVTLLRDDEMGYAEAWVTLFTPAVPYDLPYPQERGAVSTSVNIGLRQPNEGRLALRELFLRFVEYMAYRVRCQSRSHGRKEHLVPVSPHETPSRNQLECTITILKVGNCTKCILPADLASFDQHDEDLIPEA